MARDLSTLLDAEIGRPVEGAVQALAERARQNHGDSVAAVLFYGSCVRQTSVAESLVDLYVVVDGYRQAYGAPLTAALNWLLPPNVYYLEVPYGGSRARAKYAVISRDDFVSGAGGKWFHPYLWARFSQPCRLVFCRDEGARQEILGALTDAVLTAFGEALALTGRPADAPALWTAVFRETYRTELRAERSGRVTKQIESDPRYFESVGAAALDAVGEGPLQRRSAASWFLRRVQGKVLSVLRLVKAAFTFDGGAEYLKWKIERHSGVEVPLTPWQRRHPILGSITLFWSLYRRGAFR